MVECEVVRRHAFFGHPRHGECIAERHCHRGARRGHLIDGGGLAFDRGVEHDIAVITEHGLCATEDAEHLHGALFQKGHDGDQFVGVATVADEHYNVAFAHDANVAVQRIKRVEVHRQKAHRREARRNLLGHEPRLAHTGDDHLAGATH